MKTIDTSQITDPISQQPFTGKSLEFLQNSVKESLAAIIFAKIGSDYDPTKVYILNRCELDPATGIIDNGYVFWNGEIYLFTGANTSGYSNVPVIKYQVTYDTSIDPVLFSDGVNKYVHEIRSFFIDDGVSGSTAYGDYADVEFLDREIIDVQTPAGGNFGSMGVTFTGPSHDYNCEIYIEADVSVSYVTDGRLQASFVIKNLTTAGFYPAFASVVDNTNTSAGKTRTQRMCATWRKTGIAGGTNLQPWLTTTAADQHTFGNVYMRFTEF